MRRTAGLLVFLLFLGSAVADDRERKAAILERMVPSTVKVYDPAGGSGSGVVVRCRKTKDKWDTYVLTCYHVVDSVASAEGQTIVLKPAMVQFYKSDGRNIVRGPLYRGYVWKWNKEQDVAILKLTTNEEVPEAKIADLSGISVTDDCVSVGCPLGGDIEFTTGMVQEIDYHVGKQNAWRVSASITHGNSGGGCWTADGRLIGLTAMVGVDRNLSPFGCVIPYMAIVLPISTVETWLETEKSQWALRDQE